MEEEKRKAYSEVVEILKLIEDENRIEKIPFEVIKLIKNNADPEYKPNIDKTIPLENQSLRKETYSILGWIANKYWDEDIIVKPQNEEDEKEENIEHTETQKTTHETINNLEERASAYNDLEPKILEYCSEKDKLPAIKQENNWFIRLKKQIIKILEMLFRKNNIKENN